MCRHVQSLFFTVGTCHINGKFTWQWVRPCCYNFSWAPSNHPSRHTDYFLRVQENEKGNFVYSLSMQREIACYSYTRVFVRKVTRVCMREIRKYEVLMSIVAESFAARCGNKHCTWSKKSHSSLSHLSRSLQGVAGTCSLTCVSASLTSSRSWHGKCTSSLKYLHTLQVVSGVHNGRRNMRCAGKEFVWRVTAWARMNSRCHWWRST